jgi:uncharacterized protein YcfJ
MEKKMKTILSTVAAVAISFAMIAPMTTTAEAGGGGLKKYCHNYAMRKATKKANKKVFTNMLVGGVVGAVVGDAVGGKDTTAGFAAGGAALGMVDGASKKNKYYYKYFDRCMWENS